MTPIKDDFRWNEDLVTNCADAVVLARNDGGDASDAIRQFASKKKLQVTRKPPTPSTAQRTKLNAAQR